MIRRSNIRGHIAVWAASGVLGLIAIGGGLRWATGLSGLGFLISPNAAVVQKLEALEAENEKLKERVEALSAELDDRVEDDERERDATRRLFWRE